MIRVTLIPRRTSIIILALEEAKAKKLIGGYKVAGPLWHINEEGVYANHESPDQR